MAETPDKRRGAGGKLSRSETVTVRLDPHLRYLSELGARKHRRTLSSYIEWVLEQSMKNIILNDRDQHAIVTLFDEKDRLWDVEECERLVLLGLNYPELLIHEEQRIWKMI